MALNILC